MVLRAIVVLRGEGRIGAYVRDLRERQFESIEQVRARQQGRLQAILVYAAEHSPHYRRLLPTPARITASEIHGLPLLTKQELQSELAQLQAQPLPFRVTRKTTGGSTGQAVTVVKDRDALAREMAATQLAYGWFGIRPGDRSARFWGSPPSFWRRLRAAAVRLAVRRVNFSAFAFNEQDLETYWQRCLAYRPAFFYGYVSMLETFAEFVRRRGYDGRSLKLRSIVTTSEILGAPQRKLLEEVFGTRVQNEYGCGEVGPIAYECERGALHVMVENLFVELIKDDGQPAGPGETGEVVVTDLNNRATLLIRYRVGDYATWGTACDCGRSWPTFERVWGREYDFVLGPNGRRYHGEFFMYIFEDLRDDAIDIRQFQVVQTDAHTLVVSLVLADTSGRSARAVRRAFEHRIPGMRIEIKSVESIPRATSGKLRVIQNDWIKPSRTTPSVGQAAVAG